MALKLMLTFHTLIACLIFNIELSVGLGPLPTLSLYLVQIIDDDPDGPDTINDNVFATLWFNSTIYQYKLSSTEAGSVQTSTSHDLQIINCNHNVAETKIMLTNNHADSVIFDKIKLSTPSGAWYGIDGRCISQNWVDWYTSNGAWDQWLIDVASCSSGKAERWICINNDNSDCGPSQQMLYFDTLRKNQYIQDAVFMGAEDISVPFESCEPTSEPTYAPLQTEQSTTGESVATTHDPNSFPTKAPVVVTSHPSSAHSTHQPTSFPVETWVPSKDPMTNDPTSGPIKQATSSPPRNSTHQPTDSTYSPTDRPSELKYVYATVAIVTERNTESIEATQIDREESDSNDTDIDTAVTTATILLSVAIVVVFIVIIYGLYFKRLKMAKNPHAHKNPKAHGAEPIAKQQHQHVVRVVSESPDSAKPKRHKICSAKSMVQLQLAVENEVNVHNAEEYCDNIYEDMYGNNHVEGKEPHDTKDLYETSGNTLGNTNDTHH